MKLLRLYYECLVSYETWLTHLRQESLHTSHDSLQSDSTHLYETWLTHMRHDSLIWDMTHSHEAPSAFQRESCVLLNMTHSSETWLPSRESWLTPIRHNPLMWDMTPSYEAFSALHGESRVLLTCQTWLPTETWLPTDGGDRTWNNYDCQNFQHVFIEVPVHVKHDFLGVPKISNRFSRE